MKKILFGIFMILTSITFSSEDISYELREIASETRFIRYKYFKYDDKKVVAVVSKDPNDFAKKSKHRHRIKIRKSQRYGIVLMRKNKNI